MVQVTFCGNLGNGVAVVVVDGQHGEGGDERTIFIAWKVELGW